MEKKQKKFNPKRIKSLLKNLEYAIGYLIQRNLRASSIGGKYGELFVCHQLSNLGFKPQIGDMRENKKADICIKKGNKEIWIEVKWGEPKRIYENKSSKLGIDYEWGFGKRGGQILNKKFNYCILLCSDTNGKIKHSLVLRRDDFNGINKGRSGGITNESYFILFFKDIQSLKEWENKTKEKVYPLEVKLVKNYQRYDNKWSVIR